MTVRTIVGIFAVLASSPALAANFACSSFQVFGGGLERPKQPTCIDELLRPFDDRDYQFQFQVQTCQSEIETYRGQLNSYLSCLKSEGDDVISSYNDMVRRFNCKARGWQLGLAPLTNQNNSRPSCAGFGLAANPTPPGRGLPPPSRSAPRPSPTPPKLATGSDAPPPDSTWPPAPASPPASRAG
jgi:hypothetical protein